MHRFRVLAIFCLVCTGWGQSARTSGAIEALEAKIAADPNDYMAHFDLGRAFFNRNDFDRARQQFEWVAENRPEFLPARTALAQLALRRDDVDTALKSALEILQTAPDNTTAQLLAAAGYLRKGDAGAARTQLNQLLEKNPRSVDALLEMGVLELKQLRYEEAEKQFRTAFAADPSNVRGIRGVAETWFQRNEPDRAVQVLSAAYRERPARKDLMKELANAEQRAMRFDEAIRDYQALAPLFADNPIEQADVYSHLANCNSARGDVNGAINNSRKAAGLVPDNAVYNSQVAGFLNTAGKYPESIASYRTAMQLKPNDPVVMNNLAFLIVKTGGDLDEALALAGRARELRPDMSEIQDTVGWIYFKKNSLDNALQIFEQLVQKPGNASYHYHYGAVLAKKGSTEEALKQLRLALQFNPAADERGQIMELIATLNK
jgi:tetratricopeptide (TPR) repeat protein